MHLASADLPLFRALLSAAGKLPPVAIRAALALAPLALKMFENLQRGQIRMMTSMLRSHSPRQLAWSCRAILEWTCERMPECPIYSIHGEQDEVIPLRRR